MGSMKKIQLLLIFYFIFDNLYHNKQEITASYLTVPTFSPESSLLDYTLNSWHTVAKYEAKERVNFNRTVRGYCILGLPNVDKL